MEIPIGQRHLPYHPRVPPAHLGSLGVVVDGRQALRRVVGLGGGDPYPIIVQGFELLHQNGLRASLRAGAGDHHPELGHILP